MGLYFLMLGFLILETSCVTFSQCHLIGQITLIYAHCLTVLKCPRKLTFGLKSIIYPRKVLVVYEIVLNFEHHCDFK